MDMMDILSSGNPSLFDSNMVNPRHDLIEILYDCRKPEHIPLDLLREDVDYKRAYISALNLENSFSVPYSQDELDALRDFFDDFYKWHSGFKPNPSFKKGRFEKRKTTALSPAELQDILDLINLEGKEITRAIHSTERRSIEHFFSEEQKYTFDKFFKFFSEFSQRIKRNFHLRYNTLKHHNSLDLPTDEQIVSAACVLGKKGKVNILSSDSDIKRLLVFLSRNPYLRNIHGLYDPTLNITIYSDYGKGLVEDDYFEEFKFSLLFSRRAPEASSNAPASDFRQSL